MVSGRTRQNKFVHCAGSVPVGATVEGTITQAAPHWLRGDLGAVLALPRVARTRIPVTAG